MEAAINLTDAAAATNYIQTLVLAESENDVQAILTLNQVGDDS